MGTISITNLGKAYKQYPTRWSRLVEWFVPFSKPQHQLKWVLQDINFTGRVAALLELGMGFHPNFTGRQNTYLAGQLLGMGVEEITSLMPEIEAFAEIGDYMDQPVRVYSSGMQMRVAFSIATARRPDVLIVDEALSVGDAYFQHKSFDRIREFRKQGTTLLIVSHDKSAIQSICDRAILLNEGKLAMQGQPEAVMDYYNAMIAHKENSKIEQIVLDIGKVQTISGTGEAEIENETGLVVPPSDPLALRQAMRYLWEHPEIAAEMGKRAEDRYWNYFTADKMVEEYVKLYRELAGK